MLTLGDEYNHERLHSSLSYLRPVDYYRGNREALLAEHRRKSREARAVLKQESLKLRRRPILWMEIENVAWRTRRSVSL